MKRILKLLLVNLFISVVLLGLIFQVDGASFPTNVKSFSANFEGPFNGWTTVTNSWSTGAPKKGANSNKPRSTNIPAPTSEQSSTQVSKMKSGPKQEHTPHGPKIFSDDFEGKFSGWTLVDPVTWFKGSPSHGAHSIQLQITGAIQRTISTVGYNEINISFEMGADSLDSSDENMQMLWFDGSDWNVLAEIDAGDDDNLLHEYQFPLPKSAENNPDFAIRFQLNGNSMDDYGFVDDVLIRGEKGVSRLSSTPTSQQTPTPTSTVTPTFTPRSTNTPTSTVTPTSTPRSTNTPTSTVTPTSTPRPTNTPTSTVTPTSTPRSTNTPTPTVAPTSTPRSTNTPTPTVAPTSIPRSTNTPTPTVAPTSTPRPTNTPASTVTPTSTTRATNTPTSTVTPTSTPRATNTSISTPTSRRLPTLATKLTPIAKSNTLTIIYGGTVLSKTIVVKEGESVKISASPDSGYQFVNWTQVGGSGTVVFKNANSESTTVTVTGGAATIRANYAITQCTLTVTNDGNGKTTPQGEVTVMPGTSQLIAATPDSGYQFVNWTQIGGAGKVVFRSANSENTTVTVTGGNAIIRANFVIIQYTLTVTNDGKGGTTPLGNVTLTDGASKTITATANNGYRFVNWTQTGGTGTVVFGNANSESTTVTITGGNAIIRANFEINQYTLTVTSDGNGRINPLGEVTTTDGASIMITATANSGYQFVNWTVPGGTGIVAFGDARSADTKVTVTGGDVTIKANFSRSLQHVITVAGGGAHSLALKNDGTVWAWGKNDAGQLGNGTMNDSMIAVPVNYFKKVIAIGAGGAHSIALTDVGTVWAWGANNDSQLGNGTRACSNIPVQVNGLTHIIAIAGGENHNLALKNDGTVWAWGSNDRGQLGTGTTTSSNVPVQVSRLTNVIAIAGGGSHSLAIKIDGTVWAWGDNQYGQLGNGTITNSSAPVQVSNLTDVITIAAGGNHSLALKSDGTVWAWGHNKYGQLGTQATADSKSPVQVSRLSQVIAIAAGFSHNLAVKRDGTVWAWGDFEIGGLRVTTPSSIPIQVNDLTHVYNIAAGGAYSLALKDDNTVLKLVNNQSGEIGNGSNSSYQDFPVQVSL
ncbi:MAG TPA: hypothetical protein VHY08_15310 [Bacillota bacterium]|nr:hypothetical protein [Bacillota bacterium]